MEFCFLFGALLSGSSGGEVSFGYYLSGVASTLSCWLATQRTWWPSRQSEGETKEREEAPPQAKLKKSADCMALW